jgi:hypothetical protein
MHTMQLQIIIGYLQKLLYTVKRIRMSPTPTLNIYLFEGPIVVKSSILELQNWWRRRDISDKTFNISTASSWSILLCRTDFSKFVGGLFL